MKLIFKNMTVENLIEFQKSIQSAIQQKAYTLFDSTKIEPIYDGVCDAEKYLNSATKVMWILKEAYDAFDESGLPMGGGWEIYEQWDDMSKLKEVTSVRSWQPIMYVLHALAEEKHWDEIAWIRDDRKSYVDALKGCAYININKMPAGKISGDLTAAYDIWRDFINMQIIGYRPDVIIFGFTYGYFSNESYIKHGCKEVMGVPGATGVYKTKIAGKPTILIDAYHPNQKILSRQEYVDSILFSIRKNL